jgi:hypothetical protein
LKTKGGNYENQQTIDVRVDGFGGNFSYCGLFAITN